MNFKEYLIAIKNKILKYKGNQLNKPINNIVKETEQQLSFKSEEQIYELLEKEIKSFFPKSGDWSSSCFTKANDLNMEYLPCHLRDNEWLAKMLQQEKHLQYISLDKILNYINNSKIFAGLRHNYELNIVKYQIDLINSNDNNLFVDKSLGKDYCVFIPQSEIAFRKTVSETLTAIGINNDVIEEGLEKYADIWRKKYMSETFDNKYYNTLDIINYGIEAPSQVHKNVWLKMREYEYYCNHKNSVDLYGEVTDNMKMSPEEVKILKIYLYRKDVERLYYIEECKRNSSKRHNHSLESTSLQKRNHI